MNATVQAMKATAVRIQALEAEARQLEASIKKIVVEVAPGLLVDVALER